METQSQQTRFDKHEAQLRQLQSDVLEIKTFIQTWESNREEKREFREVLMSWINQQGKNPKADSGGASVISGKSHYQSTPFGAIPMTQARSSSYSQFLPLQSSESVVLQFQNPYDSIKKVRNSVSPLKSAVKAQYVGLLEIQNPVGSGLNENNLLKITNPFGSGLIDKGPLKAIEANRPSSVSRSLSKPTSASTSSSSAVPSRNQGVCSLTHTEWKERRTKGSRFHGGQMFGLSLIFVCSWWPDVDFCFRWVHTFDPGLKRPEGKTIDDGSKIGSMDSNEETTDLDVDAQPTRLGIALNFHEALTNSKSGGAAIAFGLSLFEVAAKARHACRLVGTRGIALSVCPLSGQPKSDRLGPGKMELGLGIHGEPRAIVANIQPVDLVVSHVRNRILSSETNYVPIKRGSRVVLMINGLGATPVMELMIAAGKVVPILQLEHGLVVDRVYTGSFMTSLDMAGFSISIMKAERAILQHLDAPTKAPHWPVGVDGDHPPAKVPVPVPSSLSTKSDEVLSRPHQLRQQGNALEGAIETETVAIINLKDSLNKWDSNVGDGDCGSTMSRGVTAIQEDLKYYLLNDAAETIKEIGSFIRRVMGGTSGIIHDTFGKAAYAKLKPNNQSDITPLQWAFEAAIGVVHLVPCDMESGLQGLVWGKGQTLEGTIWRDANTIQNQVSYASFEDKTLKAGGSNDRDRNLGNQVMGKQYSRRPKRDKKKKWGPLVSYN